MATTPDQLFQLADQDRDGVLTGGEAVTFFMRSGLQKTVLRQVWELATNGKPSMDRVAFAFALKLIAHAQSRPAKDLDGPTCMAMARGVYMGPDPGLPQLQGIGGVGLPAAPITPGNPPPGPALTLPTPGPAPAAALSPTAGPFPPMTDQDEARYRGVFAQYDKDGDGLMQGGECVAVFSMSGLPRDQLSRVWQLVAGSRGALGPTDFAACMYLIEQVRKGTPLPAALPPGPFPPRAGAGAAAQPPAPAPPPPQPAHPARGPIDLNALVGGAPNPSAAAIAAQYGGGLTTPAAFGAPAASQAAFGAPSGMFGGAPSQGGYATGLIAPGTSAAAPQPARAPIQTDPTQHQTFQDLSPFAYTTPRVQPPPPALTPYLAADERSRLDQALTDARNVDQSIQRSEHDFSNAARRSEFYAACLRDLLMFKSRATQQLLEAQEQASKAVAEANQAERSYQDAWKQQEGIREQMSKALEAIETAKQRREETLARLQEAQAESQRLLTMNVQEEVARAEAEIAQFQAQIQAEVAKGAQMRRITEDKHRREAELRSKLEEARLSIAAAEAEMPRIQSSIAQLEADLRQVEDKPVLREVADAAKRAQSLLNTACRYALRMGVLLPEELQKTPISWDARADASGRGGVQEWDDFHDDGLTNMHANVVLPLAPPQAPAATVTAPRGGAEAAPYRNGGYAAAGPSMQSSGFGAFPPPVPALPAAAPVAIPKPKPAPAPQSAMPKASPNGSEGDFFDFLDDSNTPKDAAGGWMGAPVAAPPAPKPAGQDLFSWE